MPKARAAPNVSQKNKKERNLATPAAPLAALQPRRVSTGMPNVTRRLEKHVALARRGQGTAWGVVRVFSATVRWAGGQHVWELSSWTLNRALALGGPTESL